jgi:hypothetical protein
VSVTPKTAATGISGAFTGVLIWVLTDGFHINVSAEHAAYLTAIITFGASYFAPRSDPTPEQVTQILQTNAMQQANR